MNYLSIVEGCLLSLLARFVQYCRHGSLVGGSPPRNGRDTHTDRQTDRFKCDYVAARKESLHVHIYLVHGGICPYPKD